MADDPNPPTEVRHLTGDDYNIIVVRSTDGPPVSDEQLAADLLAWKAEQLAKMGRRPNLRVVEDPREE